MSCTLTNIETLVINEKNYNPSTDRSSNTKVSTYRDTCGVDFDIKYIIYFECS